MSSRLADRLIQARQRRLVGRTSELALFQSAIAATELPFYVLFVCGPGGVGKTTLLSEFATMCAQSNIPAFLIDSRNIEPAPEAFVGVLRQAMGLTPPDSPLQALAEYGQRQVILIDTSEVLAPIEGWLRDTFLPQLPEHVLVVMAGREPPSLPWRADPGWQPLIHILPLHNLSLEESQSYLTIRLVPDDQHRAVIDFTHGHPLALSLVADVFAQRSNIRFQPEAAPDVIKTLLEQFVQKVPGPAHRAALEVCALVRLTTEALLAATLHMPDVHALFEWLRGLSFIEAGPKGLFPHDLAREALDADVRWRNPDWYAELHRRARTYYNQRMQQAHAQEQQRILADYIFLHRNNPVVRPFFEWQASGGLQINAMRAQDQSRLLAMVTRHEGAESAQLAAYWFARQPPGVLVARNPDEQPAGLLVIVALHQASAEDMRRDPATQGAWRYLQEHAPLRPGESATLFRFWMAHDAYQAVSPIQSLIFVSIVRHYLTTPGLAFTFFPCADPDFWLPMLAYADLQRIAAADFVVGERHYGVYGHDWRVVPPHTWLELLAEREITTEPQALPPAQMPAQVTVLSQSEFAAAVRAALHDLARPDSLRSNPLLQSRVVVERSSTSASATERVAALQALLKAACDSLQAAPRDVKAYRALYHTYWQPAPTQEQAAELLDLPFSTFRRHLKVGITRVTEMLWQWEVQGPAMNKE